ncbi:N-ethylmaleimide reductase [Hartmannibacter diazotrophicus]|uniref:N-ethylmaleimide reductase n=1 Tax=Hartmannibacter diazotrophicus TaxID=1482074 RepID=A0A2C9D8G8_9HYPH|nr:alkene reductase [Hartmannibacter diazotrophicus]SON56470.1 N-ethylmaleimide reductase [Hartmannibacter diazotrophicus]
MTSDVSVLFQPLAVGDLTLANRIVMAPLTRNRATRGTNAPNDLNVQYYVKRADAGLLITEASQISQQGQGYIWTPGIFSSEQVAGWRKVTDAVHAAGGKMAIQLWHVGRISHVSLQKDGAAPVAPSAIKANGRTLIEGGMAEVSEPRALDIGELPGIVADYVRAAQNAKAAGFDAVEVHAANNYLIEQFLRDSTNKRSDAYGGPIENRARLLLEVVDAVVGVLGKGRVGVRLSPVTPANDGGLDSDPQALFGYVAKELAKRGIAYIHVIEGETRGGRDTIPFDYAALKAAFGGVYIANNGFSRELAIESVSKGHADAIAFGRAYIANPDLVSRIKLDAPWNEPDTSTFYGGTEKGYTDYPTLKAEAAE